MASARKSAEDEGGEFADFMADISQEIAQRVESLAAPDEPRAEERTEAPAPEPGVILDWDDVTDRMIEEMR